MALIITLILLSVVTFMAVTFLVLSQRERGSVATVTDTAGARFAADAALASAEAQIMANVLATTNPFNFGLLVSTNYINPAGFQSGASSYTNVNYQYANGTPISVNINDFLQNLTNLWYSPRPPVFVAVNSAGSNDFRYYLDLNRNGRYDTNGVVTNVDNNLNGLGTANFQVGDPEWIGVLERPDAPYGPNNKFIARYAFIAVPVGNTLDLNAIHNQARSRMVNPAASGNDGFLRNQGVGSWEINLAAFLADLNTNEWNSVNPLSPAAYQYNEANALPAFNTGYAFEDSRSLLSYRYGFTYNNLATVQNLYGLLGQAAFRNNIDGYSDGPLMTTLSGTNYFFQSVALPWVGADNTNRYFTHQELFDPAKTQLGVFAPALGFSDRLLSSGTNISTYDRYTFYRLLSQLGTDTTPDSGRMNLNYDNLDRGFNGFLNTNGVASATNFVPWQPLAFFTNAADRLLRAYTTQWRNSNPTNFAATFYTVANFNFINADQWTNYPAFGIGNIPVLVSNQFVYSSAVNRLLQLAANMYDASTNNAFAMGKNYPSVFRPLFSRDANIFRTNVFISGYTNVVLPRVSVLSDVQLNQPIDVSTLADIIPVNNWAVNVYGVPWIIGAKKGFPNFNEFTMQNVVEVERKLQVIRQTLAGPITTNQMYIFSVSNSLGAELWNSYNSNYVSPASIQVLVRDNISMVLTNDAPGFLGPRFINGGFTNTITTNLWPGSAPWTLDGKPQPDSFFIPLNPAVSTVVLLTNSVYYHGPGTYSPPSGGSFSAPCFIPQYLYPSNYLDTGISQLPHFGLLTTNRLQLFILEHDVFGNYHVIDYAHFAGPNSIRDLNAELQDPFSSGDTASDYMWSTNAYNNNVSTPYGVVNQLNYSRGIVTPNGNVMGTIGGIWDNAYGLLEQPFFDAFFYKGNAKQLSPPIRGQSSIVNTNLSQQAPFSPVRMIYEYISWQANDPLVHYLASDLNYSGRDTKPPTGLSQWNSTASPLPRPTYGILNYRYQPWGISLVVAGADTNAWNFMYKDPLIWQSDDWDFPTNKFPTVGWLGRVHRGTPWQTVYLKASDVLGDIQGGVLVGTNTWTQWTGDTQLTFGQYFDAINGSPTRDRLLFDLFTTAFNDNATRGTLSVNVGPTNANLAAWSALLSGVLVLTNTTVDPNQLTPPTYGWTSVNPAGVFNPTLALSKQPALVQIVDGINQTRANTNWFPLQSFEHVGDILSVPQLTEQSPFLNWSNVVQQQYGVSDEMYEWLPQQTMSLLRCADSPRYVIYCYGQTLKPAPDGIYNGGGAFFGMITNYQVVSEIATRAVVRFGSTMTNILVTDPTALQQIWTNSVVMTNNNAVIESFNLLPPD
ncbi:MAG: hypothetical protein WAO02_06395 [Verrucomicrobiia bacterium]